MLASTSKLVAVATKAALPATVASAFVLGAALFAGQSGVHAATLAGITSGTPLDANSVSALTALDRAMEAVTSKVTPSIVNIEVTAR